MEPIQVSPRQATYDLLLTATTPISHHDPAVTDESNRSLFNRQKQILPDRASGDVPGQATVDLVCRAWPAAEEFADLLADLSFPEFVACCLTRLFVDCYGRGDGEGLFAGVTRYAMLEPRLKQAAVRSSSLRGWWNRLTTDMLVGIHDGKVDALLLPLLSLPRGLQALVLEALAKEHRSIVSIARAWAQAQRLQLPGYAEAASLPMSGGDVVLRFDAGELGGGGEPVVAEVPAVSANSLRHQAVRYPAWLHLCEALGLAPGQPGQGPVPAGVEAMFVNGGNIAAGTKAPQAPYALARAIRAAFPSLDLLGGVTDAFDLGESRLHVAAWLVCRENAAYLAGTPAADLPGAGISAYDMLDDVTMTRQGEGKEGGQMIFGGEALCTGAQVLCRLSLDPWTPTLTHGALVAAVDTYLQAPVVGGQAARGFGWMRGAAIDRLAVNSGALRAAYEEYLEANQEQLRGWLVDGTLGCGSRVVS